MESGYPKYTYSSLEKTNSIRRVRASVKTYEAKNNSKRWQGLVLMLPFCFSRKGKKEMSEETLSVEEFLTNTEFTIPVVLEYKANGENRIVKRTIQVTYAFDDEIAKKLADGEMKEMDDPDHLVDDPDNIGVKKPGRKMVKVSISLNKQLAMIVRKVGGSETPSTEEFWERSVYKYRQTIIDTILEDIYPKKKPSTG